MIKYPKTDRVGKADTSNWNKLNVVVSEKMDGANAGIEIVDDKLQLQSRGHVLVGGWKEAQFDHFKSTAYSFYSYFKDILSDRYVLFGEWLYAKHRIYYDALPNYFMPYDLWDKENEYFLNTDKRHEVLRDCLFEEPPILHRGKFSKVNNFEQFIGKTLFKTDGWKQTLVETFMLNGVKTDPFKGTDKSDLMEGVYIKIEDDENVVGRMKLPRTDFEKVRSDDDLWKRQIIIPNHIGSRR